MSVSGLWNRIVFHYLTDILRNEPTEDVRFEFHGGTPAQLLAALRAGELDLAITTLVTPPKEFAWLLLKRLPLALLAPRGGAPRTTADLVGHAPLVCPTGNLPLCQLFDAALRARGLRWEPRWAVPSLPAVPGFVAAGCGVGLGVSLPRLLQNTPVDALPLEDYGSMLVLALWRKPTAARLKRLLAAVQQRAEKE